VGDSQRNIMMKQQGMGDVDLAVQTHGPASTATLDARATWSSNGSENAPRLADPEVDQLIHAQAAEVKGKQKRYAPLKQLERTLIDVAAAITTSSTTSLSANYPYVKNWHPSVVSFEYWAYQIVWLDR